MKPEEPVDLHVVRSWGKSWWGLAEHPNKKTNYTGRPDVDVPLIVIGEARRGGQLPENKEVYKFVTRNKNKTKPGPTPRSIYDGCEFCGTFGKTCFYLVDWNAVSKPARWGLTRKIIY